MLGPEEVKVERKDGETEVLDSDYTIIATGSEPISLPGLEVDEENILSSRGALSLKDTPDSMLIIGGGYIGIEMAFIFSALGTEITIVELEDRLLPNMDKDLSSIAEKMMKKKRIKVHTESKVEDIEKGEKITAKIGGKTEKEVKIEKILSSVGRRPTPPVIDDELDIVGDKGEVEVGDRMKTDVNNLYAVGDVTGKGMLAHSAFKQAEIAVNDILGKEVEGFSEFVIPAGIYTHPEMASVGVTEEEAKEKFSEVNIGKFSISRTGRGSSTGKRMGIAKVVAGPENELIGLHLACPGATDMIMEGTTALEESMTAEEFADMIHPHPTFSEALKEAAENVFRESVHSG